MPRTTGAPALFLAAALLVACIALLGSSPAPAAAQSFTHLGSDVPLVPIRIMVKAGSAHDPEGKEGLAFLTAALVLEGGFGEPSDPLTREGLARRTAPWGDGALPGMRVDKESTTFSMRVPSEVMGTYTREILAPMLSEPLFDEEGLERIRDEVLTCVESGLRKEDLEHLGLEALDNYIHEGTGRGHLVRGSVQGLKSITREDIRRFYTTWYEPVNTIIGVGSSDEVVHDRVREAVRSMRGLEGVRPMTRSRPGGPRRVQGREMTIVAQPDAPGAVINIGFPIPLLRSDEDFWPLWVANVWFGTHRDSFSRLYRVIRQERGYNCGDYSYIEHFAGRPAFLFPPFNTPRTAQYFSIWIRTVDPGYVHHLTKAAMWELEDLVRRGLSPEQVEAAKNKARILYPDYAETASRLLEAKVDDVFYGMHERGFLEGYRERIEALTAEQVNAAIREYLQTDNVKILVATEAGSASALRQEVVEGGPACGKGPADYGLPSEGRGEDMTYRVPAETLETLYLDGVWARCWLGLESDRVRVVPVEALFETGAFITLPPGEGG
ncbi:MAG: pitrilysin family protein [bacterium]